MHSGNVQLDTIIPIAFGDHQRNSDLLYYDTLSTSPSITETTTALVTSWFRHRFILSILALLINGSGHTLAEDDRRQDNIVTEIQLDNEDGPLLLSVLVEPTGAVRPIPLRVILDTAATVTFFDSKHAAVLGPPIGRKIIRAPSGVAEIEMHNAPAIIIGSQRLRSKEDVACLNLNSLGDALGQPVDGLLGMDVLKDLVIAIDFDRRRVAFCRAASTTWGEPVPLLWRESIVRNCPFVRATIDGAIDVEFLLDTGAAWPIAGSLDEPVYDEFVKGNQITSSVRTFSLLSPTRLIGVDEGRISILSLGSQSHKDLAFFRLRFSNTLSLGFLSRYHVAFDFPNSKMYLRPGSSHARRDVSDRVGIGLVRTTDTLTITNVSHGTPGFEAHLQKSDVIVAIDGAPTKDMAILQAWRRLSRDGHHTLMVRRGAMELRVALEIRP